MDVSEAKPRTRNVTRVMPVMPNAEMLTACVRSACPCMDTKLAAPIPVKCMPTTASPMTTALSTFSGARARASPRKRNASHSATRDTTIAITTDSATIQ
jgi:hypothetical protein